MYAYANKPKVPRNPQEQPWKNKDAWRVALKAVQHMGADRPEHIRTIRILDYRQTGFQHQLAVCCTAKEVVLKILPSADAVRIFLGKHPRTNAIPIAIGRELSEQEVRDLIYAVTKEL